MEDLTLPQAVRKLERYVMALPSAKQFNTLSSGPRKAMMELSDSVYNLRINVERYFYADDSGEQKLFLAAAIEQAKAVDQNILLASNHDLLSAADVAILGAMNEQILQRLG